MKKISILISLAFVLSFSILPAKAITWGEPDTDHDNVGAMVIEYSGPVYYPICSGTLIHPRIFLTAGHCTEEFEDLTPPLVWVTFDQYASPDPVRYSVEQVITHPDYYWGPQSNPHDVGILILEEDEGLEDIELANLPEEGFLDDLLRANKELKHGSDKANFTVVGYGGTLEWPPPDIIYDDGRQSAVSEFRALLPAWLVLSQNQATGDGGSCYGDSGGPAFWTEEGESEILVGVTSWGDIPCVATGFNYRVDIPEVLDWITGIINSIEVE